jgi:diguanylate cyclase (GGDEF)-like protein
MDRRRSLRAGRSSVALFSQSARSRRRAPLALATAGDLASRLKANRHAIRSRVERRETLLDVMRAVNTTLEPTRIAELAIERVAAWIPAPHFALISADPTGQLSVLADRGLAPDMGPSVYAVAEWVMQRGEEFITADLRADSRVSNAPEATIVAFPLSCRGRRVGAIVAVDPEASGKEPRLAPVLVQAIRVLLEPISVGIENALQLKRTEALSVTDDLTRLYNSRYLNQVLRRETKRASRSARPVSLLFLDLDGFKSVNDRHGHMCGSRALVEAAAVIKGSARETDVVARFGGDEFALILPDTGADGAYAVGERIRDRVAAHQFLAGDGLNLHLTVSVGVATLPDAAASADDLMRAADAAMYQVKDRGKNGIQVAGAPADN